MTFFGYFILLLYIVKESLISGHGRFFMALSIILICVQIAVPCPHHI